MKEQPLPPHSLLRLIHPWSRKDRNLKFQGDVRGPRWAHFLYPGGSKTPTIPRRLEISVFLRLLMNSYIHNSCFHSALWRSANPNRHSSAWSSHKMTIKRYNNYASTPLPMTIIPQPSQEIRKKRRFSQLFWAPTGGNFFFLKSLLIKNVIF